MKALPLTVDQLRAMSTNPETANVAVLISSQMLANWLEGLSSFADPDATHTRVVVLEVVLPVGALNVEGTMVPLVDLVFRETVHYVEEGEVEEPEVPSGGPD